MKRSLLLLLSLLTASFAFAQPASNFTVGSFNFTTPTGWKSVKPVSPMRKAQLEVPGSDGAAEVTFFNFGAGMGGSVQANVDRWLGQFGIKPGSESHSMPEEIGSTKVTFVKAEGTYQSGMPGQPKEPKADFSLLGAIIEDGEKGDVYVKMVGPTPTVVAAEEAFRGMIKSSLGDE